MRKHRWKVKNKLGKTYNTVGYYTQKEIENKKNIKVIEKVEGSKIEDIEDN